MHRWRRDAPERASAPRLQRMDVRVVPSIAAFARTVRAMGER